MTQPSDERREVAESIRRYAKESDKSAYEFIYGYFPNDLANLIDPTCEIVEDEPYSCHCSACGQGRMYPQMYWRYCPHCGTRMVRANE